MLSFESLEDEGGALLEEGVEESEEPREDGGVGGEEEVAVAVSDEVIVLVFGTGRIVGRAFELPCADVMPLSTATFSVLSLALEAGSGAWPVDVPVAAFLQNNVSATL